MRIVIICFVSTVIGTAFALNMLFSIPVWIGVLLTGLSTLMLLALQQYGVFFFFNIFNHFNFTVLWLVNSYVVRYTGEKAGVLDCISGVHNCSMLCH